MRGGRSVTALPGRWFRMCTADGRMFGSVAEALRMTRAGLTT